MCGILGIVNKNKRQNQSLFIEMRDTMFHRGPDDGGIWISTCELIYFAHRRLSIIDLSRVAHQPMVHPSNNFIITYNGELYNFLEIKEKLIKRGHRFMSKSDTEVIAIALGTTGVPKPPVVNPDNVPFSAEIVSTNVVPEPSKL